MHDSQTQTYKQDLIMLEHQWCIQGMAFAMPTAAESNFNTALKSLK